MALKIGAIYEYRSLYNGVVVLEALEYKSKDDSYIFRILSSTEGRLGSDKIELFDTGDFKEMPHYRALVQFDKDLEELLK